MTAETPSFKSSYSHKVWKQRFEDAYPLYCTYDGALNFQRSPNAALYCWKCFGTDFTNVKPTVHERIQSEL